MRYLRIWDVIGCSKRKIKGMVPISHATLYEWMNKGKFPKSYKLSDDCVAWLENEVLEWMDDRQRTIANRGERGNP